MKRLALFSLLLAMGLVLAGDVLAYRVTGTFMYRDREQDITGYTGDEPLMPIKGADVEVLDDNTSELLASGVTSVSGEIDINVSDAQVRDIVVRVLTSTVYNPFLNLATEERDGPNVPIAMESAVYPNHNPASDLDIGTVNAEQPGAGDYFNLFDCQVNQMRFVGVMTGDNPGTFPFYRLRFTQGAHWGTSSYFSSNIGVFMAGDDSYDDAIILHEGGHFTNYHWSDSDSPGGSHTIGDVNQDPRLSYGEGIASFWWSCTSAYYGLNPTANLYVEANGGQGPGQLDFVLEYERPNWGAYGPACESAVTAVLYDILDNETWPDPTPGVGEDFDELSLPTFMTWWIADEYIPNAQYYPRTIEDFWDAWMLAYGDTARYDEMKTLFDSHRMEFWEDDLEPDNTSQGANTLALGEIPVHHTLYPVDDPDWFVLQGIGGATLQAGAINRQPATHSLITVYEPDAVTPIADNSADVGASVSFVTEDTDMYYIKVNQHSFSGIYTEYGAYDMDLRLTQAPDDSAEIQVTPAGIVVPGMMVGTTTEREFTINNNGGGPLKVTVTDHERYVAGNPPAQWISESTDTATVGAGGSLDVTAFIDATGLHPDTTYDAIILISSNDMINPEVEIILRVMTISVGIGDDDISGSTLPKVFALNQNYPNPFNPSTSIVYDVPEAVEGTVPVRLTVYNMRGQMVRTLVDTQKAAGQYTIHWDGTNSTGDRVSSGIYFYKISAGDFVNVKKMVLLK